MKAATNMSQSQQKLTSYGNLLQDQQHLNSLEIPPNYEPGNVLLTGEEIGSNFRIY
jgi:hypothetical protein